MKEGVAIGCRWLLCCELGGLLDGFGASAIADPPPLNLFVLPRPQLRASDAREAISKLKEREANTELALQTSLPTELDMLVQRHEAMNGQPPLRERRPGDDSSRFQRTLDSFLPPKGGFLQKNPNALSSPLSRSEYWTK